MCSYYSASILLLLFTFQTWCQNRKKVQHFIYYMRFMIQVDVKSLVKMTINVSKWKKKIIMIITDFVAVDCIFLLKFCRVQTNFHRPKFKIKSMKIDKYTLIAYVFKNTLKTALNDLFWFVIEIFVNRFSWNANYIILIEIS